MSRELDKIVEKAGPLLEEAFQYMLMHDCKLPDDFEKRMEQAFGRGKDGKITYEQLKHKVIPLVKHPKYVYVAVSYMEGTDNVPMEFHRHLAEAYGVRTYNHSTAAADRRAFWSHWPEEDPRGLYKEDED